VIARWWQAWRRARETQALQRRAIPDELWQSTVSRHGFLSRLDEADQAELRRLASLFLDSKEFSGAGGFDVTDEIAVSVAAQACLPVLRLGLAPYAGFVGIVMHADEVVARREVTDEAGVVHHYEQVLAGEAMEGGPVMLSWHDVSAASEPAEGAYNVVIHEFVHVLDMGDGVADGVPPLPSAVAREKWQAVLMAEFDRFSERVVCGYPTAVDAYGAEAPEEFFAVAAEAFFVTPAALKEEQPAMYRLLSSYFLQDPAGPA
jgi:Mlc titration factor MtfA (ptsG expression regulator)